MSQTRAEAPIVAGFIYDKTGSYTVAFLIAGIASLIAGVLALFLPPPKKRVPTSRKGEALNKDESIALSKGKPGAW